jgi:hypothetical protein
VVLTFIIINDPIQDQKEKQMSDNQDEMDLDETDSASAPAKPSSDDGKVDDLDAASTEGDLEDLDSHHGDATDDVK